MKPPPNRILPTVPPRFPRHFHPPLLDLGLSAGGGTNLLTDLQAYYRFDSGGEDTSGHNRYVVEFDGLTASGGVLGRCLGPDVGVFTTGWNPVVGVNVWTFSLWFKVPAGNTTGVGFSLTLAATDQSSAADVLYTASGANGRVTDFGTQIGPTVTNNGTWHNVVTVKNGTARRVYLDGVLILTDTKAAADVVDLGLFTTGDFAQNIDEFAVWSKALSAAEVAAVYNGGDAFDPTRVVPVNTVLPVVSGTPTDGEILSVTNGTWTGPFSEPSYSFQWYRDGVAIGGEVGDTYTLTPSDVGAIVTAAVTASDGPLSADATAVGVGPVTPGTLPSPPVGNPAGEKPTVYVADADSGFALYVLNEDTQSEAPASVVKLMTVLLAWEALSGDWGTAPITLTAGDVAQPIGGLSLDMIGFGAGDVVTADQLAHAILLPSDCAGCQAFARVVGATLPGGGSTEAEYRSQFVTRMNGRGAELGIVGVFYDSFGGSKTFGPDVVRNTLSAKDAAKLCVAAMAVPTIRAIAALASYDVVIAGGPSPRTLTASNYNAFRNGPLFDRQGLADSRVKGGKNGVWNLGAIHANNLAQIWESPSGVEVVISVMGSESPWALVLDVKGIIYSLERDFPYLATGPAASDASWDEVEILVGGDVFPFTDESDRARAVTNTSVTLGDPVIDAAGGAVANATTDALTVANAAALNAGTDSFTAELWWAGDGSAPGGEYVWLSKWGGGSNEWVIDYNGGLLQIITSAGNSLSLNVTQWLLSMNVLFNGAPRHLALVKNGSSWAYYVNGERCPGVLTAASVTGGASPVAMGLAGVTAKGRYNDWRYTRATARYTLKMHELSPQKFPRA